MMEAGCASETLVYNNKTAQHNILEGYHLHKQFVSLEYLTRNGISLVAQRCGSRRGRDLD
jgi:hypothetical protein